MRPFFVQKLLLFLSIFFVFAGFVAVLDPREGFVSLQSYRFVPSTTLIMSARGTEIYGLLTIIVGATLAFFAYRIQKTTPPDGDENRLGDKPGGQNKARRK